MIKTRKQRRRDDFRHLKRKVVKPAPKRKPAPKPKRKARSTAAVPRPASAPPAGAHPEFANIERRPAFIPRPFYWTGGAILKRLRVPAGWQLADAGRPSPEYRLVSVRSIRTAPEGETVKLHRYALKESVREDLAAKALRLKQECELDDLRAHNASVSRTDRFLLLRRQILRERR
jgi:hypothetical protein